MSYNSAPQYALMARYSVKSQGQLYFYVCVCVCVCVYAYELFPFCSCVRIESAITDSLHNVFTIYFELRSESNAIIVIVLRLIVREI
jgi:hypothetical protein